MNKEPYNYIENRIKEVLDNSEANFDQQAWHRMEALLDKGDQRRKPFYWFWLLLAVLVISGFYFLLKPPASNTNNVTNSKPNDSIVTDDYPNTAINNQVSDKKISGPKHPATPTKEEDVPAKTNHKPLIPLKGTGATINNRAPSVIKFNGNRNINLKGAKGKINTTGDKNYRDYEIFKNFMPVDLIENKNIYAELDLKIMTRLSEKNMPENKIVIAHTNTKSENKPSKENNSKIYFTLKLGGDITGVKMFSYSGSPITPKYGIGLGYQLSKKISLETGFYASSKKYIAGAGLYKFEPGSYYNSVEMLQVDADCYVFEIPIILKYNFLQKSGIGYYGIAGISSLIMQNEDYKYHYNRNGYYRISEKSYKGNTHFLSSLQLGLGVEKKLSDKFSLLAEPAIHIPLSGAGNGKIKLHSTSLQVGIKFTP